MAIAIIRIVQSRVGVYRRRTVLFCAAEVITVLRYLSCQNARLVDPHCNGLAVSTLGATLMVNIDTRGAPSKLYWAEPKGVHSVRAEILRVNCLTQAAR